MPTDKLNALLGEIAMAVSELRNTAAKFPTAPNDIRGQLGRVAHLADDAARACAHVNATVVACNRVIDEVKGAELHAQGGQFTPRSEDRTFNKTSAIRDTNRTT